MDYRHSLSIVFLAGATLFSPALAAQAPSPSARIVAQVNEAELTELKGGVPLAAQARFDQGPATASTQLTHMRLVLSRSAGQQAALDAYLAQLQDKSSPNYHKWLTPGQFGKLYGPADSDLSAIVAWLESHSLKLEEVSIARTNIAFSGTASQVEEAFHTPIHSFVKSGEQFYSNIRNPQIPTAIAAVVMGVAHLNTIRPRPQSVKGHAGLFNTESKIFEPLSSQLTTRPSPNLTTGTSATGYTLYLVPADAATIYNTPNAFNLAFSGTSYTGAGVTIGVGGDAIIDAPTVAAYRTRFLGDSVQPTITNVDNVTSTLDADEGYIDTELAGGLAPGAAIHFYTSTDLYAAIQQAINDNTVDIFSLSFGLCERYLTSAENAVINGYWQQAAALGIAVVVSTGDTGSAGCDYPTDNLGHNVTAATGGLQVNGLSSTPYNVAVGGTDYDALNASFSTYVDTAQGASATFYRTAKGYIPEATWNDSTVTNTTIGQNAPLTTSPSLSAYANIVAGGGGPSNCSNNASTSSTIGACTSGYPKPSWQRGAGVPADSARDLPDVSLMSGDGFYSGAWLVCTNEPISSGSSMVANCTTQTDQNFYFYGFGGTSTATPAFAGILALVQQKTGSRLGQAAAELYDLYNGAHAASIFHDVTTGNISVPCSSGSSNCNLNTAGYNFVSGYNTTAGYDLATGLGSIDATQLVTYWGSATGASTATLSVTPSATTITTVDPLTVTVSVAGSGSLGTPTGTLTLTRGSYTSGAQSLASGAYTFNIPAGSLAIGTDTLTVTYSGDPIYASTTDTSITLQVDGLTPTVTVTPSLATLNSNTPLPVAVTVTATSGSPTPGGTITLSSGSYSSGAQPLTAGSYNFTIPAYSLAAGSNTLTVTYSGDSVYTAASNNAVSVSVTLSTFALSAAGSSLTLTPGAATGNTSTISVTPAGGFTGAVNLSCAVTTSLPSPTSPATCAISTPVSITGSTAATSTLTVSTTATTTPGAYLVTVTGVDAATGNITSSTPVNVTVSAPASYALTNSGAVSVVAGATTGNTSTITITPSGGFTGTVALGCSVTTSLANPTSPATCTIPASVDVTGSTAVMATLTVVTTSTTTAGSYTVTVTGTSGTLSPVTSVSVTVTAATGSGGSYTLSATTPTAVTKGTATSSTVTASSTNGYAGTVTLSCALTSSPTSAADLPTCTASISTVNLTASTTSGTATFNIATTAAPTAALEKPAFGHGRGWAGGGAGALSWRCWSSLPYPGGETGGRCWPSWPCLWL